MPCTIRSLFLHLFYTGCHMMEFLKLYRNVPSVLYFTTTRHLERGWNLTAVVSRLNSLLAMRYSHGVHKNKISPHSYMRLCGKDGAGFEPTYTAWKATVLPLNYPSSGLPAASFIYSHFHSDSAALSATYRMNTLPLAHDTFLYCFSGFIQYRNTVPHPSYRYSGCLDRKHW